MRFETLLNKDDPRLYEFRKAVCLENGGTELFLEESFSREETFKRLPSADANPEEVYKFGRRKWEQARFHSLETVSIDGKIVSLSACEEFNGEVLRVGMLLYTLKPFRIQVRDHMFSRGGFFSRHLEQARRLGKRAVFLSVYPYTRKLRSHAKNLSRAHRTLAKGEQPYLADLEELGLRPLRNVEQYIVGYKLDRTAPWPQLLPEILEQPADS